ncbi:N-6 DNA methylase [Pedobacter sp. PF22-3]|uniref:N-6 DNA methylase n=1 Tax=Pedobacter sp. PF22-3 TaxID=2994467 RepID=UPI0022473C02|nr:N-6 DNA methylase [Pedobacter sp. PF22-3]
MAKNTINKKNEEPLEKQLWKTADKLRKNIDAAEYKHIVLGLIFLKYISDAFEEQYASLKADEANGADPEDKDEYKAENIFFVPQDARWIHLQSKAKLPDIGRYVDDAMDAIEKENSSLKGVLPKVFARQNLDPTSLGELIDLVGNIALGDVKSRSADVLGHVFEYFLGEFALAEGKKGGQFYTPRSVVELLVELLEPYKGRVYDPCCGSGGMFVHSEKFVLEHQGRINDISIYGQESNQTTWRLAKMNLAIRGIDSSQVKWNNEGSFLNDAHKDLKADYIIANPPFNDSDWSGDLLRTDGRWKYGTPSSSNANFAWIQHFIYHLSPNGKAAFVIANSSLASENKIENEIRAKIINQDIIECIVSIPGKLFYSTPIPVCIWLLDRNKIKNTNGRKGKILFIDASRLGKQLTRTSNSLTKDDIDRITSIYRNWKKSDENYKDLPGFCKTIDIENVANNDYILFPAKYLDIDHYAEVVSVDKIKENMAKQWNLYNQAIIETNSSIKDIENLFLKPQLQFPLPLETKKFKLSEILEKSNERLGSNEEPEILTCTENAGLIFQKDRFSKRIATDNTSKYMVVRKSDIVYNPYLLWAGAIDQCWIVDIGITSPAYEVLRVKKGFNPTLIGTLLKSDLLKKMYDGISIGTIQRRRRAPVERFLDLEVVLPTMKEQEKLNVLSEKVQIEIKNLRNSENKLQNFYKELNNYWLNGSYDSQ